MKTSYSLGEKIRVRKEEYSWKTFRYNWSKMNWEPEKEFWESFVCMYMWINSNQSF